MPFIAEVMSKRRELKAMKAAKLVIINGQRLTLFMVTKLSTDRRYDYRSCEAFFKQLQC